LCVSWLFWLQSIWLLVPQFLTDPDRSSTSMMSAKKAHVAFAICWAQPQLEPP
jgi:hypothetical protein